MITVKKKAQDLCSRIAVLETVFITPTNDIAEKKQRDGLLQYATASLLFRPGTQFP